MTRIMSFAVKPLVLGMLISTQYTYALQILNENDLRDVNGQDGIYVETTLDSVGIDQLYWEDQTGSASTTGVTNGEKPLRALLNDVAISGTTANPVKAEITLNTGTKGTGATATAGIDLAANVYLPLLEAKSFKICDKAAATCSATSLGSMGVQSSHVDTPLNFHLTTQNGLFNKDSDANLKLGIKNLHIYLGQKHQSVSDQINQLVLKNVNFNLEGQGRFYIDQTNGLVLTTGTGGYVDLLRVANDDVNAGTYASGGKSTSSGLNLEFMLKNNVKNTAPYVLNANNSPQDARGLIRIGASGRIVNGSIEVRGVNEKGLTSTILGNANQGSTQSTNSIMGSSGIATHIRGEFVNTGTNATTLEIGGAGTNAYGFEFSDLSVLKVNDTKNAYFDSGNVYINLVDTKSLSLPVNAYLNAQRFGGTAGATLTINDDYKHDIHNGTGANPYAAAVAIRGAEFQALSKKGRFTNSAGIDAAHKISDSVVNQWGLALPFYNLNANLAVYGTTVAANSVYAPKIDAATGKPLIDREAVLSATTPIERLGFTLAMSTDGVDRDATNKALGNKTTSILVIDGATNYYMGLRNVDMLMKGTGTMGVENGSLNIDMPTMLVVMAGEVAAGYLPGATYKTCTISATSCNGITVQKAVDNNFALSNDVLMGMMIRFGGAMSLSLIPNNNRDDGSSLTVVGDLKLDSASKNSIQISDPADKSIVGLDNITGHLQFNNAIKISRATNGEGEVSFNTGLKVNPQGTKEGVLRVRDLNLYPPNNGAGQRLGELALTGGTLNSQFKIVPRN